MDRKVLYDVVEARRRELGLTQSQVGERVTGRADTSVVQHLRRGAAPSFERVSAICTALGLELYVGPPRDARSAVDAGVLEICIQALEEELRQAGLILPAGRKAKAIAALYELTADNDGNIIPPERKLVRQFIRLAG